MYHLLRPARRQVDGHSNRGRRPTRRPAADGEDPHGGPAPVGLTAVRNPKAGGEADGGPAPVGLTAVRNPKAWRLPCVRAHASPGSGVGIGSPPPTETCSLCLGACAVHGTCATVGAPAEGRAYPPASVPVWRHAHTRRCMGRGVERARGIRPTCRPPGGSRRIVYTLVASRNRGEARPTPRKAQTAACNRGGAAEAICPRSLPHVRGPHPI